jgi:chloramphenicol 3-O-phosphotransferase
MTSVRRLVELVRGHPPRCGATRLACVDGRSGSGKTTLAARLAAGLDAPVLHLDDLYPGWDGLAAAVPLLHDGVVTPLVAGRSAAYRRWDWQRGGPAGIVRLGRPDVLVVEGVGSGARVIAEHAVLLVWTEAPDEVRHRRGMARDGETYRPHWARWAAQEDDYLAAEDPRARADVVIDTT